MRIRFALGAIAAFLLAGGSTAQAAPACAVGALNALGVAHVTVTDARTVPAQGGIPAHCDVLGTLVTQGAWAPDGLARFAMQLPLEWRQRFLFLGVGGNAGNLVPSANGVDRRLALGKGYVTVLTDTGHVGDGTTAKWARKPDGSLDRTKVTDFFHRSTHDMTVAGKAFAQAYYAAPVLHAYFDGCSTGGRMAMIEAERYPDDYAGVIAGDPAMDYNLNLARIALQKAAMRTASSYIPPELLAAIDARVTAQCDVIDGARDGLVQNPARCPVKAEDLQCRAGRSAACLNPDQTALVRIYLTPIRDRQGRPLYAAWQLTHMVGSQGAAFYTFARTAPNLAEPLTPWGADDRASPRGWKLGLEALANWMGEGPSADLMRIDIDSATNTIGDALLARSNAVFGPGNASDPAALRPFIARGGKLIMYHGASDPSIPAARTVGFYRQLSGMMGGGAKTEANVRLFLVPGMHHCAGGPGPDQFDMLTALETWVEQGQAPAAILASTAADAAVKHRLPLCPYPRQARYSGAGDVADDRNWSCRAPG